MKLKDRMDTTEYVTEMCEGNPGAINVMMSAMMKDQLKGLCLIFWLDHLKIYGSRIWVAYREICADDIDLLLRLCQSEVILLELKKAGY